MREKLHKINDIFSWVLLIATSAMLIFAIYTVKTTPKGEGAFFFGYRPVYILTGSMEPYMMTNGVCLTQKVDSMEDIAVGDVVTFHIPGDNGKTLNITHRIISIDNGIVNTKGDNNSVSDDLPLTIDNIDAKVICVFNQTAWLVKKWETTTGKVMLISFGLAIIFGYYFLKFGLKSLFARMGKKEETAEDSNVVDAEFPADKPAKTSRYQPKFLKNREK